MYHNLPLEVAADIALDVLDTFKESLREMECVMEQEVAELVGFGDGVEFQIGDRVIATKELIEGEINYNVNAEPGHNGWKHADEGDEGTIVDVEYDDGQPNLTVVFDLSGEPAAVFLNEIERIDLSPATKAILAMGDIVESVEIIDEPPSHSDLDVEYIGPTNGFILSQSPEPVITPIEGTSNGENT